MTDPGPTHPSTADKPFHLNFLWRAYDAFATGVDHRLGWAASPQAAGALRPGRHPQRAPRAQPARHLSTAVRGRRRGTRLGPEVRDRNAPSTAAGTTWPTRRWAWPAPASAATSRSTIPGPTRTRLLEPNPRTVSRRLMTRDELLPATARQRVDRCVAAVHDPRLVQARHQPGRQPVDARRSNRTTTGPSRRCWCTGRRRTRPPRPTATCPPTYINVNTHWWDGSQIYGNSADGAGVPARTRRRPAAAGRRPSADPRRPGAQPDAGARLLARPRHDADALRARAQQRLRDAREAPTPAGTTRACSSAHA